MSFYSSIILSLVCVACARAGTISLGVEEAADYALKRNPALAAARLRIEEARGRWHQSGRLGNPELEAGYSRDVAGREGAFDVGFTQRFPLTSRLRAEKAVSRAELAAAEAEMHDAARKLAAEVRMVAIRLLALDARRELRDKQRANSRELSEFLRKRVEQGEISSVEFSQVELETRQIEIENLQLAVEEAALLGELRPLLGLGEDNPITIWGTLPEPRSIPGVSHATGRSDILAAELRAEAARSAVVEQRARRWEDIGIGASYSRERVIDEPETIGTEHVIGLRFSLPLPLWNNNSGRIREAQAAAARADMEVAATMLNANAEAHAARAMMNAYARLIGELDDTVLPVATRIEEQLRDSYATGLSPLADVLRARTRLLELQQQRLDALRDYHLARIRHAAAVFSSSMQSFK